jgi:hypothetical protein
MHLQQVQAYLRFRKALPLDLYALTLWLVERALEHDKPTLLLQLACDELRRERIVRPGLTRLERLVATARQQAHEETFRRLTPLLTDERPTFLDGLLLPDPQTGRTVLNWLRREATSHAPSQIVETLKKVAFLLQAGVDTWELGGLNPNRVKWLAQLGWKAPTQQLQRMEPMRRAPILVAFLHQALLHHTDVVIELYDQCLWAYHGAAQQELKEWRAALARSTNDKLRILRAVGQVLLDPTIDDAAVRAVSFARVPEAVLRAAVDETAGLIRPRHDDAIDFFASRYSTIRQFAPAFLRTLTFHTHGPDDTVLRAVEVIRALDREPTRRPVLRTVPMALVTDAWRPYIWESDSSISRRYYELCTLWHLRSALRAGNIWVEHSRRYANPDTYLIPPDEWPRWRPEIVRQTGTPGQGLERLHEREAELETAMAQVERLLARQDSHLRIEEDQLVLAPLEASPRPPDPDESRGPGDRSPEPGVRPVRVSGAGTELRGSSRGLSPRHAARGDQPAGLARLPRAGPRWGTQAALARAAGRPPRVAAPAVRWARPAPPRGPSRVAAPLARSATLARPGAWGAPAWAG